MTGPVAPPLPYAVFPTIGRPAKKFYKQHFSSRHALRMCTQLLPAAVPSWVITVYRDCT